MKQAGYFALPVAALELAVVLDQEEQTQNYSKHSEQTSAHADLGLAAQSGIDQPSHNTIHDDNGGQRHWNKRVCVNPVRTLMRR